jgi:hypothetical protein
MKTPFLLVLALMCMIATMDAATESNVPDQAALDTMIARFAPTEITADLSKISPNDRKALARLVEASQIIDGIFLRQRWSGNPAMLLQLAQDQSAEGRTRLHYFLINKGPWSQLDHDQPFVVDAPPKPDAAGFYPADATKSDLEAWMKALSPADQKQARGFFTVIRRTGDRKFTIVPYNIEYEGELIQAAALLRQAAAASSEPSLKKFLTSRADAFLSNDYYASDVAWMELSGAIEPTIGPYEVYEDGLFNYKASYEAFITVQDEEQTAKLHNFSAQLQDIEDHLPIDPKYRNPKLGALAPLVVVNEIFAGGDGNHGVQTAAFNLPNDERVTREKGSKRVMLKNVQDAKFAKTLVSIAQVVLSPADQKDLSFDAFFSQIVVHEMMHGLGPHTLKLNGRETTVRQEMKELGSALEEAKADISSLFAIQHMIDKGVLPKTLERPLYTTYLASSFRSIRFGTSEAHGLGMALQQNYLLAAGAFVSRPDGTFAVDFDKVKQAVAGLTGEIMTIQAEGNYSKAKALLDKFKEVRPEVQKALDKMSNIPVDIEPKFTTAEELVRENP